MKKLLALTLGACLALGLGGCANTPAEKTGRKRSINSLH